MARIISHRGHWLTHREKNARTAFVRSFEGGFGTETDVRDRAGVLVISHDPPAEEQLVTLDELLGMYADAGQPGMLALNVKADGLQVGIFDAISRAGITSWFAFDMSVPDTLGYRKAALPYFTRLSEYERSPVLLDEAAGIWLDAFETEWFDEALVSGHIIAGRVVCLVSPELHGRDPEASWSRWADWDATRYDEFVVCTDRPTDLVGRLPGG